MIGFIGPASAPKRDICSGSEFDLSLTMMKSCTETSKSGEGCEAGLKPKSFWKAGGNVMEGITIEYKSKIKPSKVIFTQQPDFAGMGRKLFI